MVVDSAVVNVLDFARNHPGGSRIIVNAIGTDVTAEVVGREDASVARALTVPFSPHMHSEVNI